MPASTTSDPASRQYRSYLLRIWRAEAPARGWRASLEDPRTGERFGFAGLEQLFAFLMEQAEGGANDAQRD